MSKKISLNNYCPSENDKVFIDNNIWLFLFCPIGNHKKNIVNAYNNIFLKMVKSKCTIYTSSLILSEFFNTYSRIDFDICKKNNPDLYKNYKRDFRNSEYYTSLSEDICEIINNKILRYSKRLDDNFHSISIDNILIGEKNFDFNDKYFAKLCEDKDIKILTNDKDFLSFNNDIQIITM